MSKKAVVLLAIVVVMITITAFVSGSAVADVWIRKSIDEVALGATDIVRGEVISSRVELINILLEELESDVEIERFTIIHTIYQIRVIEVFAGGAKVGSVIEFMQQGGQLGDTELINPYKSNISYGDDLILFLHSFDAIGFGHLPMVLESSIQGAYRVPSETVSQSIVETYRSNPNMSNTVLASVNPGNNITLTIGELIRISSNLPPVITPPLPHEPINEPSENRINPFIDVRTIDWFYSYVGAVYNAGLMLGTSTTPMLFSPNVPLTRGMVVTILHRIADTPSAADKENPFDDVGRSRWYADAIVWAAYHGIVLGFGDGRFGPNENITRQDLAAIFNRFVDFAEVELHAIRPYTGFYDSSSIAGYAATAVQNFYSAGIINGRPGNIFYPRGHATRAEAAAIIYRFLNVI
ncbi:MAG: S-layer homology domain-containing protein [Oscillospiraceae bacterium]|nr:S-layer homology domain-containing protein [Oscillospiraceae bacterium]